MEYNNLETKNTSGISRNMVFFSVIMLTVFVAVFIHFYYTRVLQVANTDQDTVLYPITQEDIDAIISLEPVTDPETAFRPEQIDAIIRAEESHSPNKTSQEFTRDEILKIQQAN